MQLIWFFSVNFPEERAKWLSNVLLNSYGIKFTPVRGTGTNHVIRRSGEERCVKVVGTGGRPRALLARLGPKEVPTGMFSVEKDFPVLLGKPFDNERWFLRTNNEILLGIDIFGTLFSILSREEEIQQAQSKTIRRFPARDSFLVKTGLIERPVVDEHVEMLWSTLKLLWPKASRIRREGKITYTCDVDNPLDPAATSWAQFFLRGAGDIGKRRSPTMLSRRIANSLRVLRGQYKMDPNNEFGWIFRRLEKVNAGGRFYVFGSPGRGKGSGWYDLRHPFVRDLLKQIDSRGHKIGLHGSFDSHRNWIAHSKERQQLEKCCRDLGIYKKISHNRQHYLNWNSWESPSCVEKAGFTFDSTGGFAEIPGFRFGTSLPFPMWDWSSGRGINLLQEPLILMECSLLDARYMGMRHFPEGYQFANNLKRRALAYGGDFTILWHNSYLHNRQDKDLLELLLSPP
jgi:hypothetical protein